MKLKSGKTVKIVPLTIEQQIECSDTTITTQHPDGSMSFAHTALANAKYAAYGMGLKSTAELNGFTLKDIIEISHKVQKAEGMGKNPTSGG